MALHFYIGGAGSGKTRRLLGDMIEESLREPDRRFFVIVPEQATMETQSRLVRLHPRGGILNIEVLSISRLAYRVFAETGFRKETMLEEIGKTFLLEKVACEEYRNLPWFGANIRKPEYLAEMKAAVSEFMVYGVTPGRLSELAEAAGPAGTPLGMKLSDLSVIMSAYEKKLREGSHMTAEEVPERLAALAPDSELIRGSVMAFDGFTGFTPLQLVLLRALMPLLRDISFSVTMDASGNPFSGGRPGDLFLMSRKMVHELMEIAAEKGIPAAKPVYLLPGSLTRHGTAPRLARLEDRIFRLHHRADAEAARGDENPGGARRGEDGEIRLISCGDPRGEIAFCAGEISRLVRTEGLRYRDFAIVCGDPAVYGSCVREIFPEYGIPFFIDEKRSLLGNPFMEYLRAALEAVSEDYSYTSVFRMLKSGMTDFGRDEIARLENYVLARGVRGKRRWREPFIHSYRGEDPGEVPELSALRQKVCDLLDPLADAFAKRGGTVLDKTLALYEFCAAGGAEEKLRKRGEELRAAGRPDLAREYAQVYPYVMGFLDKLVSALGDEKISMRDYRALIEAGFSEARIAIIPPGNDQVPVGDLERSRLTDVKVLFLAGANEGLIPRAPAQGGVLTESDRAAIAAEGTELRPAGREQAEIDRFYLYLTLTKPKERLILTWSAVNTSGEILRPSYLIRALKALEPGLKEESGGDRLLSVEREPGGLHLVSEGLRELGERPLSGAYLELVSHYLHSPRYADAAWRILKSAGAHRREDAIGAEAARALYGAEIRGSASRLELFMNCEFAHFLSYGLRLKERQEYQFTGLDLGSLLHASLEHFAGAAERSGGWAELSGDAARADALVREAVRQAVKAQGPSILDDGARNRYQIARMERLLSTTVRAIGVQLGSGDFLPAGAEEAFRDMSGFPVADVSLPGDGRLILSGRIDRVDTCVADGRTYVKITDYKTGHVDFDLTKVYYGLQLQLVLYLRAAMEAVRRGGCMPVPAGIFYYQIQDPLVEEVRGETDEALAKRLLRELIPSGVVLEDPACAAHFDRALLSAGSKSDVIPVSRKKDGEFTQTSKLLREEEFRALIRHAESLVRRAAVKIAGGSAEINPCEYGNSTSCDFCPYRSVCGFDARVPGYRMRRLNSMGRDEIMERIDEED